MSANAAGVYPTQEPRTEMQRPRPRRSRLSMLRTKDDIHALRQEFMAHRPCTPADLAPVLEYGLEGKRVGCWVQWFTERGPLERVVWLPASPRQVYDALRELQQTAAEAHDAL